MAGSELLALLAALLERGVELRREGDALRYSAPEGVLTAGDRSELAARKPAILRQLRAGSWYAAPSSGQRTSWLLEQLHPGGAGWARLLPPVLFRGPFDLDAFRGALAGLVERHEALRTGFADWSGQPVQVIADAAALPVAVRDAAPRDLESACAGELAVPFELSRPPLMRCTVLRLGDGRHVPIVAVHHIVADGWSLGVLARDLEMLYRALRSGRAPDWPAPPVPFRSFVRHERAALSDADRAERVAWWKRQLAGAPAWVAWTAAEGEAAPAGGRRPGPFSIPPELYAELRQLARSEGATPFMALLAALEALVWRRTGMVDFVVGSPAANREGRPEFERIVGRCVDMMPLRADLSGAPDFVTVLRRTRETALAAYAHAGVPIETLLGALQRRRRSAGHPLFCVTFALQQPPPALRLAGLASEPLDFWSEDVGLEIDLGLQAWEHAGGLRVLASHAPGCSGQAGGEGLAEEFRGLLRDVVAHPRQPLETLGRARPAPFVHLADLLPGWPVTPREGRAAAVVERAAGDGGDGPPAVCHGGRLPAAGPDTPATLPAAFLASVGRHGRQRVVYLDADGSETGQSYAELLTDARRALAGLRGRGLAPGDRVVLQLERDRDILPAFWGCVLGGFVPLIVDAHKAEERRIACRLLGEPFLLTAEHLAAWRSCAPDGAFHTPREDDLALLTLSSGSTRDPKCIMLTHRNLLARARGADQLCGNRSDDVTLTWLPLSHIGAISDWHIRPTLLGCRNVYVPTGDVARNALRWLDLISRHRATHSWAPNFAFALINQAFRQGGSFDWNLSHVVALVTGGEAVSSAAVDEFLRHTEPFGLRRSAIRPAYGMAELASGVTYFRSGEDGPRVFDHDGAHVDLGPVIPGLSVRIVDDRNRPLRMRQTGHVQFRGAPVCAGYLSPGAVRASHLLADGWFDSGDLGFVADGHLAITGRADDGIVVRGTNHAVQEIEACVERTPGVEASFTAACGLAGDAPGATRLAVFFSPSDADPGRAGDLVRAVRGRVVRDLGLDPDYLVPLPRERVGKTAIGKIRRSALKRGLLAGEFDATLKEVERLTGGPNTLPACFFERVWRRRDLPAGDERREPMSCLVFLDGSALGDELCRRLRARGHACAAVEPDVARGLRDADDYAHLLASMRGTGRGVECVFHLAGRRGGAPTEADGGGAFRLVALIQALARVRQGGGVRLLAVAGGARRGLPGERTAWGDAPAAAVLRAAGRELSWLRCTHADLDADAPGDDVERLIEEAGAGEAQEPEVAYRGGRRWVAALAAADLPAAEKFPLPFRRDGCYVISGGTGGIGRELAGFLVARFDARLLLLGRSPAPEPACRRWMEALGSNAAYAAADVADAARVRAAVEAAEGRWRQRIAGVIHLAGTTSDAAVIELSRREWDAVLRPKASGTRVLHEVLDERGGGLMLAFSSVNSLLGGAHTAAYAAANRFMESFLRLRGGDAATDRYCPAWTMWDEVGMSRGYPWKEAARANGYLALTATQGLHALCAALQARRRDLIIGLDGEHPRIRRQLSGSPGGPARPRRAAGGAAVRRPQTATESRLVELWREVLPAAAFGVRDNFFELGGDSLMAARLLARLQEACGVALPLRSLFDAPTVERLAAAVEAARPQGGADPPPPPPRPQAPPLSRAQQRLWFLWRLDPAGCGYNIPLRIRLDGRLDADGLRRGLDEIVRRHEVLRTRFPLGPDDLPFQAVDPPGPARFSVSDLAASPDGVRAAECERLAEGEAETPFDLAHQSALRARLVRLAPEEHVLLLTLHHIAADGASVGIVMRELAGLYEALSAGRQAPPPEPAVQYADYAVSELRATDDAAMRSRIAACLEELKGSARLELPTDHPRRAVPAWRGSSEPFALSPSLTARLRALGQDVGATPFMSLAAAFAVVLHGRTGQEDFLLGTDVAQRHRPETRDLVGLLVNQVPLRMRLSADDRFRELLARTRRAMLAAYDRQDLPFERLVQALGAERDPGRSPLFDVKVLLHEAGPAAWRLPGLVMHAPRIETRSAIADLMLHLAETPAGLGGELRYRTDLYEAATARRLLDDLRYVLGRVTGDAGTRVGELAGELSGMADARRAPGATERQGGRR